MPEFKFGDLICYRDIEAILGIPHDEPTVYLGPCAHRVSAAGGLYGPGLIDIHSCDPDAGYRPNHKDPAMWQHCTHLDE